MSSCDEAASSGASDPPPDPTDDCDVLLYSECEFCCGLFPRDTIRLHVKVGHEFEISRELATKRRLFACTEVSTEDFPEQSIADQSIKCEPTDLESWATKESARLSAVKRRLEAAVAAPQTISKRRKTGPKTTKISNNHKTNACDATAGPSNHRQADLSTYPELPRLFGTRLAADRPNSDGCLIVHADINERSQAQTWIREYSALSKTRWITATGGYKRNEVFKQAFFACRHASLYKKQDSPLNYDCQARINFQVLQHAGYCEITLNVKHNHDKHHMSYTSPTTETIDKINSYFEEGMDSNQARRHLELELRAHSSFNEDMLTDSSVFPGQKKFLELYRLYLKQNPDKKKRYRDYHPFKVNVNSKETEERLRMIQETARQFDQYYVRDGMQPKEALRHHEKLLRQRDGFKEEWLKDTAYLPTLRQAQYFSEKHKYYRYKTARKLMAAANDYTPELEDESIMRDDNLAVVSASQPK